MFGKERFDTLMAEIRTLKNYLIKLLQSSEHNAERGVKDIRVVRLVEASKLETCEELLSGDFVLNGFIEEDVIETIPFKLPNGAESTKEMILKRTFGVLVRSVDEVHKEWRKKIEIGEANFPKFQEMTARVDELESENIKSQEDLVNREAIIKDKEAFLSYLREKVGDQYFLTMEKEYEQRNQR